jgi:hypothetical protein
LFVENESFEKIQDFFQNEFPAVLNQMNYEIKTRDGREQISLTFAENFRFKTLPDTFNIFTLPKINRDIIVPQDDDSVIFAADFRQFEFRTFLSLQGLNDFLDCGNIYERLGEELRITKDPKVSILAYMYDDRDDRVMEPFFKKRQLLSRIDENNIFWSKEGPVYLNPDHEPKKKLHTIVQTISQYVYLRKLDKVLNILHNKGSSFIFPLHDCIILSLKKDEPEVLEEVMEILEDKTYKIKCYMGPNFKDASEI